MPSFDPIDHFEAMEPPARPTTPPVRRGFLLLLGGLLFAAALVYGIPYMVERVGYAYEAGRSKAATDALAKLDDAGILNRASALFRIASRKVSPAVVNIGSMSTNVDRRGRPGLAQVGAGSGVVIDKDQGHIVTNYHVIKDAEEVVIRTGRGKELIAKILGSDPKTDLAVLKVDATLPVEAEWGDAEKVDIGDWVLAIGSPFMLDRTVTAGIVSATGRNNLRIIGDGYGYEDFIQTDAAVNPGNSGGPLIDLNGKIIGINTAIFSIGDGGGNQGIGFAISSTLAKRTVDAIIKGGRVTRSYIGVRLEDVDGERAKRLGLPDSGGAYVEDVDPDSPAEKAGLRSGDVIVSLGNKPVENVSALRSEIAALEIGSQSVVGLYRDGKPNSLKVTTAEMPILRALGLRIRDNQPGAPGKSLVIDLVDPGSPANRAGLRSGMRIARVGSTKVSNKFEADEAANRLDAKRGIPLEIELPNGQVAPMVLGDPSFNR